MRVDLYRTLEKLSPANLLKRRSGDLVSLGTQDQGNRPEARNGLLMHYHPAAHRGVGKRPVHRHHVVDDMFGTGRAAKHARHRRVPSPI